MGKQIEYIPVEKLFPHPDNPRKDLGDLTELSDSIKSNGIFQNLTVVPGRKMTDSEWDMLAQEYRRNPTEEIRLKMNSRICDDGYTVIIGHRRMAAAKLAGLTDLPCVISDMSPQEQLRTMLMENMQRSDLTTYEQAQGFQLMLDMGETMESLSKDSGFSVSTIRRRVKLLELDQDKFRKAEARGATLMDYMELDKIEDPVLKNTVLDSIGTPNFRNKLQSAIDLEKFMKRMEAWETGISAFAVKIEIKGEVDGKKVPMEFEKSFNRWSSEELVRRPDDANSVKYYYVRSETDITIYRTPREHGKTAEDIAREKRESDFVKVQAELRGITERHFKLRNEFVASLSQSTAKKHFADVAFFAMHQIIGDGSYRRDDPEPEILDLCFDLNFDDDVDYDELLKTLEPQVREAPEKSILSSVYAIVDDASEGYWGTHWVYEKRRYEFHYKPNDELDRLYVLLTKLGYEVSDEEAEMMNGTHALLQPAKD